MVQLSITDFRLLSLLQILSVLPKKKYPTEPFDAQFHKKSLVLSSDIAVQGYILLNSIFLDHLSFLISQNRLLRQLEDFGDYIFYRYVGLFQITI